MKVPKDRPFLTSLGLHLVVLVGFLLFTIVNAFACLPYFLQWFYVLLNCFLQTYHTCLQLFDVCRLLSVPLPRFGQFALTLDSFFLCYRLWWMYTWFYLLWFVSLLSFCCLFLTRFVLAFSPSTNQFATRICACSFSFCLLPLLIFLPPLCRAHWCRFHA